MRYLYIFLTITVFGLLTSCNDGQAKNSSPTKAQSLSVQLPKNTIEEKTDNQETSIKQMWEDSDYKDILSYKVFEKCMLGIKAIGNYKGEYATIIDFTKPSSEKRLYIIDLIKNKLVYYTYVAHGKNTGDNESKNYSNEPKSLKSSLGFYKTAEVYNGKHGYSLRLDGLEQGINDKARERAIVMHGADYVNENFIKAHGRLGRSWGCPAVSTELSKEIIDKIKGGNCLYIYDDDSDYLSKTKY